MDKKKTIVLKPTPKKETSNLSRDLYWYDDRTKKMLHATGGELRFFYDRQQKRMIPRVFDIVVNSTVDNTKDINKWIENNATKYGLSVMTKTKYYIMLSTQESFVDDIEDELYKERIKYEVLDDKN